jgi:pyrroloquinoline-quinone synthase
MTSSFVSQSLRDLAQNHPLWEHEFLARCRQGEINLSEVQALAVQMYKFSKEFNRILAGILSRCPDESAQLVILDNLFDEMGQGNAQLAHPELFRKFTRALGVDDATLASLPANPETQTLVDTYLNLAQDYGYLGALGAVCYASEGIVNVLYRQIYQGIAGAAPFTPESLVFFEVHIEVDDGHAAQLASLVEPRITTEAQMLTVRRAVLAAMDARVQFFNGVVRQSIEARDPIRPAALLMMA